MSLHDPSKLRRSHGQRGFSLVELMIVVAIIGILSAMAIPQFQRFQAKAKQTEAKSNLAQIHALQHAYFGENDSFCDDSGTWQPYITCLGFSVEGHSRYVYSTSSNSSDFLAGAHSITTDDIRAGCTDFDLWWTYTGGQLWSGFDCSTSP